MIYVFFFSKAREIMICNHLPANLVKFITFSHSDKKIIHSFVKDLIRKEFPISCVFRGDHEYVRILEAGPYQPLEDLINGLKINKPNLFKDE